MPHDIISDIIVKVGVSLAFILGGANFVVLVHDWFKPRRKG